MGVCCKCIRPRASLLSADGKRSLCLHNAVQNHSHLNSSKSELQIQAVAHRPRQFWSLMEACIFLYTINILRLQETMKMACMLLATQNQSFQHLLLYLASVEPTFIHEELDLRVLTLLVIVQQRTEDEHPWIIPDEDRKANKPYVRNSFLVKNYWSDVAYD